MSWFYGVGEEHSFDVVASGEGGPPGWSFVTGQVEEKSHLANPENGAERTVQDRAFLGYFVNVLTWVCGGSWVWINICGCSGSQRYGRDICGLDIGSIDKEIVHVSEDCSVYRNFYPKSDTAIARHRCKEAHTSCTSHELWQGSQTNRSSQPDDTNTYTGKAVRWRDRYRWAQIHF